MKKKILIIGRSSFISINLAHDLKKIFYIKKISLENFFELEKNYIQNFDYLINCSLNLNYNKNKYHTKNDFDLKIAKKIKNLDIKYILISTRKIYKIGDNIKETSKIQPLCNYSKNKLITEKKLSKLLNNKLLTLRVSNLIGINQKYTKRKIHKTFIDHFFLNIKKGIIYDNKKNYKDFLSINQFSKIIKILIQKGSVGLFNVSIGKKVFLNSILDWLNFYNKKKFIISNLPRHYSNQNFYLNNSKLVREIKLKINLTDLEKDCKRISRIFFKK